MQERVPETWRVDAGDADSASLTIPPIGERARRFDIDVTFVVRCPPEGRQPSHALTVELDGRRQWSRRIRTSNPGQTDGLDYHVRVEVAAGAALRVRALTQVSGAIRAKLAIEAVEG
jgi:hypothetical protein